MTWENLRVAERFAQLHGRAFDPVIHGVECDDLGFALHLLHHRALQAGMNIGEKNVGRILEFLRKLGVEVGEDIKLGGQRGAFTKIVAVACGPEEGFAGGAFEAGGVDLAAMEDGFVALGEIFADHANKIHRSKVAGGNGKIRGGSAQFAFGAAKGSFQGIESD